MQTDEMLVLACSKKWGGRCVAGISQQTGEWVRPVSDREHGELTPFHYRIRGREIEPLDIVRYERGGDLGDPTQPENVEVGPSRWELIERVDPADGQAALARHLVPGPVLLGNRGAAVPEEEALLGVEASLALVRPEGAELCLDPPWQGAGPTRPRVRFELGGHGYDLAITDLQIAPKLRTAGLGIHGLADLGLAANRDLLLTVSLAEPRDEWCTKLVAAVLLLPEKGGRDGLG